MGTFAIGDIVAIQFPYSDGKEGKKRPALVVRITEEKTLLVCMISATQRTDIQTFPIVGTDLVFSNLQRTSFVRPQALLEADQGRCKKIGRLTGGLTNNIKSYLGEWIAGYENPA